MKRRENRKRRLNGEYCRVGQFRTEVEENSFQIIHSILKKEWKVRRRREWSHLILFIRLKIEKTNEDSHENLLKEFGKYDGFLSKIVFSVSEGWKEWIMEGWEKYLMSSIRKSVPHPTLLICSSGLFCPNSCISSSIRVLRADSTNWREDWPREERKTLTLSHIWLHFFLHSSSYPGRIAICRI